MNSKIIDAYRVLGLQVGETDYDIILQAYRVKIREWHPDLNNSENASEQTKKINDAFKIIKSYLASNTMGETEEVCNNTDKHRAANYTKRAFLFLEDKDWEKALAYCEKALDENAEYGMAYFGEYMAEHHYSSTREINIELSFYSNPLIKKAFRFRDRELDSLLNEIVERNEAKEKNRLLDQQYFKAQELINSAMNSTDYLNAAEAFKRLLNHRDSAHLYQICLDKAKELEKKESTIDYVYFCKTCNQISAGPLDPSEEDLICPYCGNTADLTEIRLDKWNKMSSFAQTTQISIWKNLKNLS